MAEDKNWVPGPYHLVKDRHLYSMVGMNGRNFAFGERIDLSKPSNLNPEAIYYIPVFCDKFRNIRHKKERVSNSSMGSARWFLYRYHLLIPCSTIKRVNKGSYLSLCFRFSWFGLLRIYILEIEPTLAQETQYYEDSSHNYVFCVWVSRCGCGFLKFRNSTIVFSLLSILVWFNAWILVFLDLFVLLFCCVCSSQVGLALIW